MAWLLSLLEKFFLDWLWGKISTAIASYRKDEAHKTEEALKASDDMKKADAITPDSTKKEQEDAAKDAFRHL